MKDTAVDVLILGGGASGLMCAQTAARRGRTVAVLDHMDRFGNKVRVSGGGSCNFTNLAMNHKHYLSENPRFATSALARFTPRHIIEMLERHGIAYTDRGKGQLFCTGRADAVVDMLLIECTDFGVRLVPGCEIGQVDHTDTGFTVETNQGRFQAPALVLATGGLSYPRTGASDLGHRIATQFGHRIVPCTPGLVPFRWRADDAALYSELAGVTCEAEVACRGTKFRDALLFTHRGISGPAVLQASNYWQPGDELLVNLHPAAPLADRLKQAKRESGRRTIGTVLPMCIPRRLADTWCAAFEWKGKLADFKDSALDAIAAACSTWRILPEDTEGYTKAEVTRGGIDTAELLPKTMESRNLPGLYCIGEVVDITGWLGGYNLHWAWASGHAAGLVA